MSTNWNTDLTDFTDLTDLTKILFENKTLHIKLIITEMKKFMNGEAFTKDQSSGLNQDKHHKFLEINDVS
ncbi:MAG: hypothetical protein P1P88_09595 [Bacteroidales bacterium]|nr:hypothetical protein [Bacteroidales bacterium]